MTCVLLVEDDDNVREPLQGILTKNGFRVLAAVNLQAADQFMPQEPDIVILDWNLPDGEGLKWLTKKRDQGFRKPVIMLTARTELVDRVIGLEFGATDYMTKPFESRELIARIHAHLRTERQVSGKPQILRYGSVQVHLSTHEVYFGENLVQLTPTEYDVLKFLLERSGQVCTREEIIDSIWQDAKETRALDNCILQLRKKIEADLIQTVRNVGYKLKAPR
jgi:DNA-binding response OmpR family regulator